MLCKAVCNSPVKGAVQINLPWLVIDHIFSPVVLYCISSHLYKITSLSQRASQPVQHTTSAEKSSAGKDERNFNIRGEIVLLGWTDMTYQFFCVIQFISSVLNPVIFAAAVIKILHTDQ